jgi:hypothetical protein
MFWFFQWPLSFPICINLLRDSSCMPYQSCHLSLYLSNYPRRRIQSMEINIKRKWTVMSDIIISI